MPFPQTMEKTCCSTRPQLNVEQLFVAANAESPRKTAGACKPGLVVFKILTVIFFPISCLILGMDQCFLSPEDAKKNRDDAFDWFFTCKGMREEA